MNCDCLSALSRMALDECKQCHTRLDQRERLRFPARPLLADLQLR